MTESIRHDTLQMLCYAYWAAGFSATVTRLRPADDHSSACCKNNNTETGYISHQQFV